MNLTIKAEIISQLRSNKAMILIDQALFAFFNFCVIFVLSKFVSIEVFSSFVLFQSTVFFSYVLCTFFLSSPILVLYAKKWKDYNTHYLKTIATANLVVNGAVSVGLYFILKKQGIFVHFGYVFLIPLLMSFFDIFKKFMLSNLSLSLVHCVLATFLLNLFFFVPIFYFINELNLSLILQIYLVAHVVATLYLLFVLIWFHRLIFKKTIADITNSTIAIEVIKHHFKYSKWIIVGGIAFWGYNQGIFIFSKFLGASDLAIGKLRTIQNLLGVTNILMVSIENFYTPVFSKFVVDKPKRELTQLINNLYKRNYLKIVALTVVIFVFSALLYYILYYEKYGSGLWMIALFTLVYMLLLVIRPMIIALKSIELTRPFFYGHSLAVIIMLLSGYLLIANYEYQGMAVVYIISNLFFTGIVFYFYNKNIKNAI